MTSNELRRNRFCYVAAVLLLLVSLAGCRVLLAEDTPLARTVTMTATRLPETPTPIVTPSATPFPAGLIDALPLMSGICFESAFDAAGRLFVLRSSAEQDRFYDLADNSGLCRQPVERFPYEFAAGDIVTGLWSVGMGCTANHEILAVMRDDQAQRIDIVTQFVTMGTCNYELVRPFWVLIRAAENYAVTVEVR